MFPKELLIQLLHEEKERRGIPQTQTVFVGIHNVAQWWWCGMYSVLKSESNELEFFSAYLTDRISLAMELGQITSLPQSPSDILEAGAELSLADLENHKKVTEASVKKRNEWMMRSSSSDKYERGLSIEKEKAESYPKFRWWFSWKRLVLVGIPDGITDKFVYEFKTASSEYFFKTASRPIANTQADLYGMFFNRKEKRVQIYIKKTKEVITLENTVDEERAVSTLEKFSSVISGKLPMRPKPFKCRSCDEKSNCKICL